MQLNEVPYKEIRPLLRNGDIALFRGKTIFSWLLRKAGAGVHSHVGCIGRHGDYVELIELREGVGGRIVSLDRALKVYNGQIDIYRPVSSISVPFLIEKDGVYMEQTVTYIYDGDKVAECMRDLAGLPYDWKSILKLSTIHLPFLRYYYRDCLTSFEDTPKFIYNKYFCSDAISKCIREQFYDLVKNRSDKSTDPSDISRSPLLSYFCTPILPIS